MPFRRKERLTDTKYTQPAIYTVSALQYLKGLKEGHTRPDAVAGHSLGEYTALLRPVFLILKQVSGWLLKEAS